MRAGRLVRVQRSEGGKVVHQPPSSERLSISRSLRLLSVSLLGVFFRRSDGFGPGSGVTGVTIHVVCGLAEGYFSDCVRETEGELATEVAGVEETE